jgi:hypothetical protein
MQKLHIIELDKKVFMNRKYVMISKEVVEELVSGYPAEPVPLRKQDTGGYCFS